MSHPFVSVNERRRSRAITVNVPLVPQQYGIVERASTDRPARLLMTMDDANEARLVSAEMRARGVLVDVVAIDA
jgi:hypothetical protein